MAERESKRRSPFGLSRNAGVALVPTLEKQARTHVIRRYGVACFEVPTPAPTSMPTTAPTNRPSSTPTSFPSFGCPAGTVLFTQTFRNTAADWAYIAVVTLDEAGTAVSTTMGPPGGLMKHSECIDGNRGCEGVRFARVQQDPGKNLTYVATLGEDTIATDYAGDSPYEDHYFCVENGTLVRQPSAAPTASPAPTNAPSSSTPTPLPTVACPGQ